MPIAKTVKGGVLVPGLELVSLYFLLSLTVLVSYITPRLFADGAQLWWINLPPFGRKINFVFRVWRYLINDSLLPILRFVPCDTKVCPPKIGNVVTGINAALSWPDFWLHLFQWNGSLGDCKVFIL